MSDLIPEKLNSDILAHIKNQRFRNSKPSKNDDFDFYQTDIRLQPFTEFRRLIEDFCRDELNMSDPQIQNHVAIKKYSEGQKMGWHVDRREYASEYFTVIVVFQNAQEGGQFQMVDEPDMQASDRKIIAFNSGYPNAHRCAEVVKGIKYSANIFVYDRN